MNRCLAMSVVAAVCCSSCGDDPKLVEKREKQNVEIVRLKGELALIEEKLKSMPPDVSDDLDEAKKKAGDQAEEVKRLEAEVADLNGRKRALQDEFDSYRAKYRVQ